MEVCPVCEVVGATAATPPCGVRSEGSPRGCPAAAAAAGVPVALRTFSKGGRELTAWNETLGVPSLEAAEGSVEVAVVSGTESMAAG